MRALLAIEKLLAFALEKGLLAAEDIYFARNQLLFSMGIDAPTEMCALSGDFFPPETAAPLLAALTEIAAESGLIDGEPFSAEQFGARLMNLITPPPSRIIETFAALWRKRGVRAATDWFYALCRASDYIRVDQIKRNVAFSSPSPYGELQITINLAKPEKDPREIAKLKDAPASGYPPCMLCLENEGYHGRPGYASHATLRTVPIRLSGEPWRLQFSPYAYYEEHLIALNEKHVPMAITRRTFSMLLEFVDLFPYYFIGSNADLPIVGGSILNHDHFQGGRCRFPMDRAPAYASYAHPAYPGVSVEPVRWPMTCLRLSSGDKDALIGLSDEILCAWRTYDDPSQEVLHATAGEAHNTLTPIAGKENGRYVLQLVLRNNRTTKEHPLGIFHPHADLHHIKRENIGLIEVMGLFILPGRLRGELDLLAGYLTGERNLMPPDADDPLAKHYLWIASLAQKHGTNLSQSAAERVLRDGLGQKCTRVLEDAGVFKATQAGGAALERFLFAVGVVKR